MPGNQVQTTKEFEDAFMDGGSCWLSCECGRTHFTSQDSIGFSDARISLKKLLKKAEKNPDQYIDRGDESVAVADIDGRHLVVDCPCGELVKYEQFIWRYRRSILEYLKTRIAREASEANEMNAIANSIQG